MLNKSYIILGLVLFLFGCAIKPCDNDTFYVSVKQTRSNVRCFEKEYFLIDSKCWTNKKPIMGEKYKSRNIFMGEIIPFSVTKDNKYQYIKILCATKLPFYQSEYEYRTCKHSDLGLEEKTYLPEKVVYKRNQNIKGFLFLVYLNFDGSVRIFPPNLKPLKYIKMKKMHIKNIKKTVKYVNCLILLHYLLLMINS